MKVGVYPKLDEKVRAALKSSPEHPLVKKHLFDLVGHKIELHGQFIGSIVFAQIRMAPPPGGRVAVPRIYAIVDVPYNQEPFVRSILESKAVGPQDEAVDALVP